MKVRIGIIGTGTIVERRHAPECFTNSDVVIGGFCDFNLERAELFVSQYGGKAYTDYKDMINDKDIDAVIVCTSNNTHAQISIDAMKAGKHVLCEKPMATNVEDCIKMVETSEKYNVKLMAAHNQRFTYGHKKAKEILEKKELGEILWFSTTLGHTGPEFYSVAKGNTWYLTKAASGFGALSDLGIHKVDLLSWLLDSKFVEVNCMADALDKKDTNGNKIDTFDNAMSVLRTENGILGTMVNSYTNYGELNNSTEIYCTNGSIKIYKNPEYPVEVTTKNNERILYKPEGDTSRSEISDAFVKSIIEDTTPFVTAVQALNAMKVIFALNDSHEQKKSVCIEY